MGTGPTDDAKVDITKKYVLVREVGADGCVRFDFAIGWPELSVELVLPQAAFDDFCRRNHIRVMTETEKGPPLAGAGA